MPTFFTTLYADATQSSQAVAQPSLIESLIPFFFIFIAMYFFMIRPQAKKAKDHADLLKDLKTGDEVVTSGGIIGRIKSVSDDFVSLDIGNSSLKVVKNHISYLTKTKKS
ncbi:MAG: preprotein translocase subunit YajC [Zetaproteobacteria bacterium]|nr:preprotein translocase subunit YajC [Pseudobdellovibrionaceae bacterium]